MPSAQAAAAAAALLAHAFAGGKWGIPSGLPARNAPAAQHAIGMVIASRRFELVSIVVVVIVKPILDPLDLGLGPFHRRLGGGDAGFDLGLID